jgi:hypothetical protein
MRTLQVDALAGRVGGEQGGRELPAARGCEFLTSEVVPFAAAATSGFNFPVV